MPAGEPSRRVGLPRYAAPYKSASTAERALGSRRASVIARLRAGGLTPKQSRQLRAQRDRLSRQRGTLRGIARTARGARDNF